MIVWVREDPAPREFWQLIWTSCVPTVSAPVVIMVFPLIDIGIPSAATKLKVNGAVPMAESVATVAPVVRSSSGRVVEGMMREGATTTPYSVTVAVCWLLSSCPSQTVNVNDPFDRLTPDEG